MPAFALTALRHWKLIGLGLLLLLCGVLYVQKEAAENREERAKINLNELRAELKSISTKRNEQSERTGENIKQAEKAEREARPIADKIREAPIPPNCATPGLDILRNEI